MARLKRAAENRSQRGTGARLVRFEERRRKSVRILGNAEVRIGRDPTCDWIVDYANVSRHHAVVRPQGDRNVVQDLGSTNGIRVNGSELGGKPHVLAAGDVIELTEAVVLLYEEGPFSSSTPWVVTAIAMILLLLASIGLYLASRDTPGGADARLLRPERGEARGPESRALGTHPGMPPPAGFRTPALNAARSPAPRSHLLPVAAVVWTGDGVDDWTAAGRVRSSGDRGPGVSGWGDSL